MLEAFSDADFAGDVRTKRSTSGVAAVYGGSAIAWPSQLGRSVGLSTLEAEFIATKQLLWLERLFGELGGKCSEVPTLYVDNASAVKLEKKSEFHNRSKHVEVLYYFVREYYQDGHMKVME